MPYSKAHVILDAIQYATEADLKSLNKLIRKNTAALQLHIVLRILLTYLPEGTEASLYVPFLKDLVSGNVQVQDDSTPLSSPTRDLSTDGAKRTVTRLKLLRLSQDNVSLDTDDKFEQFLVCRAYRIDSEIGSIYLIQELIEPFAQQYRNLATWATSTILPIQRLEQQDGEDPTSLSLLALSQLRGRSGLRSLLSNLSSGKGFDYSRDLREIIGPWMLGEMIKTDRELGYPIIQSDYTSESASKCWSTVNEWSLDLASTDYESIAKTYANWNGPGDVDYGQWLTSPSPDRLAAATAAYQQLGLALIYLPTDSVMNHQVQNLIRVIMDRTQIKLPVDLNLQTYHTYRSTIPAAYLSSISNLHGSLGELLDESNPLTVAGTNSIQLAQLLIVSSDLLSSLGLELDVRSCLSLALSGSASSHTSICLKIIQKIPMICGKDDTAWTEAKNKLLWLRDWNTGTKPGESRQGIISQVDLEQLHIAMFESHVTNGRFQSAIKSYCGPESELSAPKVKDALIRVILACYDNASNGNKSRGGIKKAADIIVTFQPYFSGFQRLSAIWALIQATHRLSFYSLRLQHGVPLLPVNIRIYPEPLNLIDKVLEQNPGSYTKLDDLLDIGKDLVKSGSIVSISSDDNDPSKEALFHQVEQSIIAKAISASLSEDDFDTAYSYIVNRLSNLSSSDSSPNNPLWHAAYQAGRYASPTATSTSTSPSSFRHLEQRMELLSQALLLAPTPSLQEVLSTWRSCERDLNTALAQESQQESEWQAKGDRTLPGGFSLEDIVPLQTKAREHTRRAMDEEAPMGLFDVARGAAAALSKSAFPLRGQTESISDDMAAGSDDDDAAAAGSQRVRKRDMVSSMVTGGLASGIGWVIG